MGKGEKGSVPPFSNLRRFFALFLIILTVRAACAAGSFSPDESAPPKTEPMPAPADGATVAVNPPSMAWKTDERAASYTVELSTQENFSLPVIRVTGIPAAFYNHHAPLATGTWYWRYFVVTADHRVSAPSRVQRFQVGPDATILPVPTTAGLLGALAPHPRIFVTPATLAEFRSRREGAGKLAWDEVRLQAEEELKKAIVKPVLLPLPEKLPTHRRQVFWVTDGVAFVPKDYSMLELVRDADRANLLSFAYLISGDERYAHAAKAWALFVANFRLDYHLKTVAERGQHDTVVYAYERGIKDVALVYDRLQDFLSPAEKRTLLDHIEYHGDAAIHWIRDVLHLERNYEESHGQQCMHMLLTTALAIAGDSAKADDWLAYMVPQYANRIPWMSDDGGYFEGQGYMFKLSYILEGLAALRTATGIDLFQKPEIKHAGDFFLYCQSMNYWWPHWGDTMALWFPYGNVGDGFMSALLASMTGNRPLQWWSDNVPADASTPPFGYLAALAVKPQPPVGIQQARAFVPTGVVAAFDQHYDENTTRLFFRSSPWGGESHAQADQNSFVLHSGGEILAADTGYYTYFGDENYNQVSTQTISKNSVLVDGKGQTNDIKGEGAITGYFNSPGFAFMAGDASKAYGDAMRLFRRDMLYVRPGLIVIGDELQAPQPAEFTWMLNAFVAPEIDAARQEFTVTERAEKLSVKNLFPGDLRYESSNQKLTPRKTKEWTRFTEAFPEPWRVHAITGKAATADIFTVLHTYRPADETEFTTLAKARDDHGSGVKLQTGDTTTILVMRRRIAEKGNYAALGVQTDGRAAVVENAANGKIVRWAAVEADTLSSDDVALFHSDNPVSLAHEPTPVAETLLTINAARPTRISIRMDRKPSTLVSAKPAQLEQSRALAMQWENNELTFAVPAGETAVLINPREFLHHRPEALAVEFVADNDRRKIDFETAPAENGDWTAYATVVPAVPGVYELISSDSAAEILVNDRWDPERSTRGHSGLHALIGDHSEIILRFAATAHPPAFTARLIEKIPFSRINLLRNGDCEAGLPGFPPRGWTVQNGCSSETYGVPGVQGWPGWSQEDAASGKGSLKFVRPLNYTVDWRKPYPVLARDQMVALAPPVRLLHGGKYVLSCETKGTATTASVEIESAARTVQTIAISPSTKWESHRLELELPAGYTLVRVIFKAGGRDDQLLRADNFLLVPAEGN